MFRRERSSFVAFPLYLLVDLICIFISFFLPYIIRWNIVWSGNLWFKFIYNDRIFFSAPGHYFKLYIFWGIGIIFFLYNLNLYKTDRFYTSVKESLQVLKAVAYSTLFAGLVVFFVKAIYVSRLVFFFNSLSLFVTLSLWRIIKRAILRQLVAKGHRNFNVLILGTQKTAFGLVDEIRRYPYLGFKIIGFLDNNKDKNETVLGYKILGAINDFENIVRQHFVDEVFITNSEDIGNMTELLQRGKECNVSIKVIPNPFELSAEVLDVTSIGHLPVLNYSIKQLHKADLYDKRIMDIILSSVGLILFSPLFLIIVIAIKIFDGGSIFYVSKRYGKRGKPFNIYKFRSMVVNADLILESIKDKNEKDGPIFKIKNDPRVNKLGRLMRKYSIDELPQVWNVLKGNMSIVGPRPLPLGQVEGQDLNQLKRLTIKPGITGLWQIKGRSDTSFDQLIKWDIWYINNWSLWLDIFIIFKTIPIVLKGKGAY